MLNNAVFVFIKSTVERVISDVEDMIAEVDTLVQILDFFVDHFHF